MTAKQKAAREKFKKVVAEAGKLRKKNPKLTQAQAVKQAWAISYSKAGETKKVGAVKKKAAPKKKAASKKVTGSHKDTKSHNVNIRVVSGYKKVGALPIDFKGNFLGYRFKVLNQYQLDGGVTAQLVELDGKGDIIAELSGNPKENDRAAAVLYSGGLATGKDVYLDDKDKKDLQKRIKSFVVGLNKEVAAYNSGKDTSKKKSKGLKIVYKPETKKLAVVDQIKSILKSNKKILKGGYTLKTGMIREKKIAGIQVINGINDDILKELKSIQQREIYFNDLLQKQLFEEAALKSQSKGKNAGIAKAQLIATRRYIKDIKNILMRLKKQKIALKRDIK
jgi:hypothetical protein